MTGANSGSERLYPLQPDRGDGFRTGACADGRQAIVGLFRPEMVAYFFAPDGTLLSREVQAWDVPAPRSPSGGYGYSEASGAARRSQVERWQGQVGFRPGAIRVRKADDGIDFAIEDYPPGLLEELAGGRLTAEEREDLEARLKWWRDRGNFVFLWGDSEYQMSGDGEIIGT